MIKDLDKNGKIITCILGKGQALPILKTLFAKGITRANFAFARGFDIHDVDNPKKGFPDEVEKEIVTVIAKDAHQGEELFNLIFASGNLNQLGGGLMFMSTLKVATQYLLPEIEDSIKQAQESVEA